MAISPVNITRISTNLQTSFVLDGVRRSQRDLYLSQGRIAAGRRFLAASEDPIGASRALDLSQALARQGQFRNNAQYGENMLSAADGALSELAGLLVQASSLTSQTVSNLTSAAERDAQAEVVAAIRQQIQTVGNRQFQGRYLFGGRDTLNQPFVEGLGQVLFVGDTGELSTRVSDDRVAAMTMPGSAIFGALSSANTTNPELTPLLTEQTRLEDITGAVGKSIPSGVLVFNEVGGVGVFSVDLSAVDTLGGVITAINNAATRAGARLTATLTDTGIDIDPGGLAVSVTDGGGTGLASSLGVLTPKPDAANITGATLTPRITRLTPVDALAGGSGIDLDSGFIIKNGSRTVTVDISTATTVQDIINTINNAGASVVARINDAGTGIDVFNQASGDTLSIGENGGTTAADLGIRTLHSGTALADLNFGMGVTGLPGQGDLRIVARNADTVDVSIDGAVTIDDVITAINAAAEEAGVSITASLAETGNGIQITDGTGGTDPLSVQRLNLSHAADDLGLTNAVVDEDILIGADVNTQASDGIIGALLDLEDALRRDDTADITLAGNRLDVLRDEMTRMHGIIGARAQSFASQRAQTEEAAQSTEIFLSEVRDLDYAQAITQLQAATTQMQAGLQTSALISQLSLMDYLR
jgi:flagellin-like hook-associated protein FlgL